MRKRWSGMTSSTDGLDLSVEVGGVPLSNPILAASGTFGYGLEASTLTQAPRLGGIVTKTITLEPRSGNRPRRLAETPSGLLNSIGLQNVGVEVFLQEKLPALRDLGPTTVVSIGGRTEEDFAEVARRLSKAPGIAALEINISCPNVRHGGMEFSQSPEAARRVVTGVRRQTDLPLWAKLSPNVTAIETIGAACMEAGADALTAINTLLGLVIDVEAREPKLATGFGGLSGPAIRPVAVARVHHLHRSLGVPVVGVGGIAEAVDVVEFLLAGASAVQIGSAFFADPNAGTRILDGLSEFMRKHEVRRVRDLVGAVRWPPAEGPEA
jgi:dihydroorotate dehydrogenase (NAD+) catalytic subunit